MSEGREDFLTAPASSKAQEVASALHALSTGTSQKEVAARHGVSVSALRRHRKRIQRSSMGELPKEQEEFVCDWYIALQNLGLQPSWDEVGELVTKVRHRNGDRRPVAMDWVADFFDRNPRIGGAAQGAEGPVEIPAGASPEAPADAEDEALADAKAGPEDKAGPIYQAKLEEDSSVDSGLNTDRK